MAKARASWFGPLAVVALLAALGASVFAQSPPNGSLAGKLTDLYSSPIAGAVIVLRNEATGAEVRSTTGRNGAYRFTGLEPGEYVIEANSPNRGRGSVGGIVVDAGAEVRVQTAMQFELPPPNPLQLASHGIALPIPAPDAALPDRTLEKLPSIGYPMPGAVHSSISVLAVLVSETVPDKPLQTLRLTAPEAQGSALGAVETSAPSPIPIRAAAPTGNFTASPTTSTLQPEVARANPTLALSPFAEIHRAAVISRGLAVSEIAARGLQAALQLSEPDLKRIQVAAEEVNPAAQAVTSTISGAELQSLPFSGRRWEDFLLDMPAASTQAGGASQTALLGATTEPVDTSIDGTSTRLAFGATGSAGSTTPGQSGAGPGNMGQAWAGGRGPSVSESAIREVQSVAGNVEAEESRAPGGRVNVATQSGSNQLHGQGFLYDRQNTWGAQNPFTQWVKETAPATNSSTPVFTPEPYTPPDHEMVWGIGLGGRIRRNKLFWFAALDSYNRNDVGLSIVKHPDQFFAQPSNDQMQLLSAQLGLPSVDPVAEGVAAYSKMLETLDGLLGPAPRTAAQWVGFARIDWRAADRHHFTLEGIGANWDSPGGGLTRVSESYGNHSYGSSQASEQWLLARWEAFLTPNVLAVTQGSAGRAIQSAKPETPSAFEQSLNQNAWGQLPQIVVDSRYGFTIGNPSRFGQGSYPDERLYRVAEMVAWARNSLLVKTGFEMGHNADATGLLRNQTGTYNYSNVANFASDALAFGAFGLSNALDANNPHNCDQTGKVWRDSGGNLRGLGNLPCYSYYSQMMGPTNWHLSTNDWLGYATAQWQPAKLMVLSAGLRWEREQLPPPIAALANSDLPLTEKLPNLGNNWGPRLSFAIGSAESRWPVLRMGYGMYYGRTENATLEGALTQTGSLNGDLDFFMRPTDNLNAGGAPPFPYVFAGEPLNFVKPGAVEFAPNFRNPEVHQAVASVEESLPAHVQLTASAVISLGRRLPSTVDANLTRATPTETITYNVCDQVPTGSNNTACGHLGLGPIKATQITVPFYANWPSADCPDGAQLNAAGQCGWLNPGYQQVTEIMSRANSTYEAAILKLTRFSRRGLTFHAQYTYAHAMDWNPNESTFVGGSNVLDPADFNLEYGVSNLDVRHSAAVMLAYETPWKMHHLPGRIANGWMLSGIGRFQSGLPYTMRTSGSLPQEFTSTGALVEGLSSGMNGSGGDNRVYGVGNDGIAYNIGRNTYRYPYTWKADLRVGKSFDLGHMRELELLAESFNLFNHQNVTELETTGYYIGSGDSSGSLPTLNFLTGLKVNTTTGLPDPAFGQPLNIDGTNFYRERQIELGLRMKF